MARTKESSSAVKTVSKTTVKPVKKTAVKETAPKAAAKKPAVKKTVAKPEAKKAVVEKVAAKMIDAEFKVFSPKSNSVAVAGDFSNWKPVALKKSKDGNWAASVKLSSGAYQYKLIFDGQYWEIDNANPERAADGQGGENSIKRV